MTDNAQPASMICPCCGQHREINAIECASCGARQVGRPLSPPDVLLPKLGLPFGAALCAALSILAFLILWILGNDMKVGRALLVWALGDGTALTAALLKNDPKLPLYRIFSYDALKAGLIISFGAIPLSIAGMWMARRAKKMAILDPAGYGGGGIARVSFALTACLFVAFSAVALSAIPDAIERGRARRAAATQASLYALHALALQKYYHEYGVYPRELEDLTRINVEASPKLDYWGNQFAYVPVPDDVIASRGAAISFSNYKLVSAGPDGKFGTTDDITMVDGVIVDSQPDPDLPTPEKTRP